MRDSFRAVLRDAAAKVAGAVDSAVAAVKPHATLDNAIKVATVVELAARTVSTVRNLPKPPVVTPPQRKP